MAAPARAAMSPDTPQVDSVGVEDDREELGLWWGDEADVSAPGGSHRPPEGTRQPAAPAEALAGLVEDPGSVARLEDEAAFPLRLSDHPLHVRSLGR